MSYEFLSEEWFAQVDALIAAAGDLDLPPAHKAAKINVTITGPRGDTQVFLQDGVFARGHQAAATAITLAADLARKIFVDGDAAAGIGAFLAGEITVDGDLAQLVAMQTAEPSAAQLRLAQQIAAITA
ncbi:MAG: SCP-2 sterol transfer family protein [Myxococcales bacterium]|nr:SCP-2 sterol transfer family protein [Myxococcales bacterium]